MNRQHLIQRKGGESKPVIAAATALAYAAAVASSLLLSKLTLDVSTVWLPAGVGVVAVWLWGYWLLPLVAVVHIAVSFAIGDLPLLPRIGIGLIATSEIGIAVWLLSRAGRRAPLVLDLAGTVRFALVCLLLVPLLGGAVAATWLWSIDVLVSSQLLMFARNWWMAVSLGILCIVPLASTWLAQGAPHFHTKGREALAVLAVLTGPISLIIVYQIVEMRPVEGILYAALPMLLWASMFLRETGAATMLSFFTLIAVVANHLLPGQAIPLWVVAAHVVAFGLIALIVANTQSSLERAVAEQVRHTELEKMAYTDELTGLANRNRLYTRLDEAMLRLQRNNVGFAVLIIDLDGFKPINDRYGHHAGDALLRILGARLKSSMKVGDLAARFGGDEFVVILADCPEAAQAISVAERLLQALTQPLLIRLSDDALVTVEVGASIGVAHTEFGATNSEALLKQADQALYAAKAAGKARIVAYDSGGAAVTGGAVDR